MIDLVYMNGEAFIWNADDWLTLRETHHITGNLVGTLGCLPRQDTFLGLPMMLMPEETSLLLEKKLARLVNFSSLIKLPTDDLRQRFEEFRERSYQEQVTYFQEERKKQISDMVDIIVEGKRKKLMGLGGSKKKRKNKNQQNTNAPPASDIDIPDKETLIEQEFNKVQPIPREVQLVQIPTESPWLREKDSNPSEITYNFPTTQDEALKCRVFTDLWQKGYYITSGHKFGGHFLVYPGDPMKFHAQFIIVCKASHTVLQANELVTLGRLGTSVRKSVVLATMGARGEDIGQVVYHTITWAP